MSCHKPIPDPELGGFTFDHIIPKKAIFDYDLPIELVWDQDNLQPMHERCNTLKGDDYTHNQSTMLTQA